MTTVHHAKSESIAQVLDWYRRSPSPTDPSADEPFHLVSTLFDPDPAVDPTKAFAPTPLPADARALWLAISTARLFEDQTYGQWGLILPDPVASAQRTRAESARRPTDYRPDDIVLGGFLGDQDLLILAPSESGQRRLLVAPPLDQRSDWYGVGEDVAEFLARFFEHDGDKYWEEPSDAGPATRDAIAKVRSEVLDWGLVDWVAMEWIEGWAKHAGAGPTVEPRAVVLGALDELVTAGLIELGSVSNEGFIPWVGSHTQMLEQVDVGLSTAPPHDGYFCWTRNTAAGDDRARQEPWHWHYAHGQWLKHPSSSASAD